jgi:ADP-ribose pyrophosphatase
VYCYIASITDVILLKLCSGLVDEGESSEDAAIRELKEETGYQAQNVIESSPVIVADPGMSID